MVRMCKLLANFMFLLYEILCTKMLIEEASNFAHSKIYLAFKGRHIVGQPTKVPTAESCFILKYLAKYYNFYIAL